MVTLGLGVFLALGTVSYFLAIHNLDKTFANVDLKPFGVIFKKAAADLVVVKQSQKESARGQGYLDAYKSGPAAFESDSLFFDTWVSSAQIGEQTLKNTLPGSWVQNFSRLRLSAAHQPHRPVGALVLSSKAQ